MKGGFNCHHCHAKSVNTRQRFHRRHYRRFCHGCDIFVIVQRLDVQNSTECARKRECTLSVQERRGRLAKRGEGEGEEKERESNTTRERENEREQVSEKEKERMTVGLFATLVSVSRTAVSDSSPIMRRRILDH